MSIDAAAPQIQARSQAQSQVQYLSFRLLPHTQAMLPLHQLAEILNLATVVPIPDMPSEILGVCNWHGEVLWLIDLGQVLNGTSTNRSRLSQVSTIVVKYADSAIGLVVDQVEQMLWCDPQQIQSVPMQQSVPTPGVQGYWLTEQGETLLVLDSYELIQSLDRLQPV